VYKRQASPYIAALFAFTNPRKYQDIDSAAIYIYIETPTGGKAVQGGHPRIDVRGPKIKTHKKHYLQQSWYTIAVQDKNGVPHIISHEEVFAGKSPGIEEQDVLIKVELPFSERRSVMEYLLKHNISYFSLVQTEEALLRTLAFEELEKNYL